MSKIVNNLKKIEVNNPLVNLELFKLHDIYQEAKTDEELVKAYHTILNAVEGSELAETLTYDMIAFSTSQSISPIYFLMLQTLSRDDH